MTILVTASLNSQIKSFRANLLAELAENMHDIRQIIKSLMTKLDQKPEPNGSPRPEHSGQGQNHFKQLTAAILAQQSTTDKTLDGKFRRDQKWQNNKAEKFLFHWFNKKEVDGSFKSD